jgi:D-xylose transport system substrate-binding protein
MKRTLQAMFAAALITGVSAASAFAGTVAVSWKTFQEERWKSDEAAIKAVVEAAGHTYIGTDAQGSAQKQAADIEGLIAQKVDIIMVVPFDSDAILPSIQKIKEAGITAIAYEVQFEDPDSIYVSFNTKYVGSLMGQIMLDKGKKEGNFAFIKGDKGDPNTSFIYQGLMDVLKPAIDAGTIKNVCETFTDGWKPDNAQKNMEQCLTANSNKIDAVISWNDGMAGGVAAALEAQGLSGTVPITGHDGDHAAINRVALGTQLVTVWKDVRVLGKVAGEIAVELLNGTPVEKLTGLGKFNSGAKGVEMNAVIVPPLAVTRENINAVIDAGHITKEKACAGVAPGVVPACG